MSGVPLRLRRPFRPEHWFTATTVAEAIGDQLARSLVPIIAVALLGAGTATVGLLQALGLTMFFVLSIPLGRLGDHLSRPTAMMTVSTAARIAALAGGLLAWRLGLLTGGTGIGILLGIMLIVGIADVLFTTGRGILVPRLVPLEQIRPVMGAVQTAAQIGTAVAPLLLTVLLALAAPPLAWTAAILAYLASITTHRHVRHLDATRAEGRPSSHRGRWRDGLSHLLAEPTLRRVTASSALHNAAVMAANTLLPVIALTGLGMSPATFAAVGGAGAVAGVLGTASASRITARFGLRTVRISAALIAGAGVLVVLLTATVGDLLPGAPAIWIALCFALSGACTSISAIAGSDLVARLTPHERLGAIAGAQRTVTMGIMPVSALLTGALGAAAGTTPAITAWLAVTLAAALPCLRLPGNIGGTGHAPRPRDDSAR